MAKKYADLTAVQRLVTKMKEYVAWITYSYYFDETTGDFVAINTAGKTTPDIAFDESTGEIYITT